MSANTVALAVIFSPIIFGVAWAIFAVFGPRKPSIPFEELAAQQLPAACGEQVEHYRWEIVEGMSCPICSGNRKRAQKLIDDGRMADLIAAAVVARMKP